LTIASTNMWGGEQELTLFAHHFGAEHGFRMGLHPKSTSGSTWPTLGLTMSL
jgi:hypothetical protein